jgi:anti-sigma factor RsiW
MKHDCGCPAPEELSALMDGEADPGRGPEIRLHALACPACGAQLRQLERLRGDLMLLRQRSVDTDFAAIVLARLRSRPAPAPRQARRRRSPWARVWGLGPGVMGGALAFGVGVYLGMALLAGSGAAVRPAGMSAFDAERAAAFCAGLPSCRPGGR